MAPFSPIPSRHPIRVVLSSTALQPFMTVRRAAALSIACALAFGFALQLAGERWDLRALAERVGLAGRLAFLGSVAALTLVFRVPESPAFIYFQF